LSEEKRVIPGLIAITEERQEDGSTKIVFEIEDGKEAEFFAAFNLEVGDEEGLQRAVIDSIQMMMDRANKLPEESDVTREG
jgi:hypothetical protein